jgi:hypothetical protein
MWKLNLKLSPNFHCHSLNLLSHEAILLIFKERMSRHSFLAYGHCSGTRGFKIQLKKSKNALTFKLGRKGINRIFAELFTESNTESD